MTSANTPAMPSPSTDTDSLTKMKRHQHLTGEAAERFQRDVARHYEGGKSIRQIAEETGRSYGAVHRGLLLGGVKLRGRGGNTRGKAAPQAPAE
ncbi:helix-turn-helix domain-containing protein [Streptomyces erythrochromogenes]|uniref:helix-turn-helix domain-containing protein n=1 Tax=Streptomyces erythrochromogenes TaxID=285574 RepID=UPI003F4D847C